MDLVQLLLNGKSAKYYGTGAVRFNKGPFLEDWTTLFNLLEEGKIKPIIMKKYPILEAAQYGTAPDVPIMVAPLPIRPIRRALSLDSCLDLSFVFGSECERDI